VIWGRALAVLCLMAIAGSALAQPKSDLWPRWAAHNEASTATIDHGPWQRWLDGHVRRGTDGVNRIPYKRVSQGAKAALASYLKTLEGVAISRFRHAEQMAYWINFYNALTVKVVLDHHPVVSILHIGISPGWFSAGPWGRKLVRVAGEQLSLDDMEHRILRPIWRDPRIHYAVNCASVGCPNLRRRVFTGARLEAMLDEAAGDYINSWHGAAFEDGELHVSSLYKWYAVDFGGAEAGVLNHLRRYAKGKLAEGLATATAIAGYRYDWDLNEVL